MEYKHTQKGYLLAGSLLGMAAILAGISLHVGWNPASIIVEIVLLGTTVLFYSMTVSVTTSELVIRFERGVDVARGDRVSREQWRNSGGWHLGV